MEQRQISGKSHWYHETQSSLCPTDALPLVPKAAYFDRFLLDLNLTPEQLAEEQSWMAAARVASETLLPENAPVSRMHTLSNYDRLSTALTVAQVYGVQRLCNYYAARLAPQPGPDSSRASNRRLTQITQYARQLASQPTLINNASRTQLDEVGLSVNDSITFNQLIGFIGFQARAVAVWQALQGLPVRWLPGLDTLQDAPAALFTTEGASWVAGLPAVELRYAQTEQLEALSVSQPLRPLQGMSWLLAHDAPALCALSQLIRLLWQPACTDEQTLVMLLSARINGSPSCFAEAARLWRGDSDLPDAVRNGERALQAWSHNHPRERAIIQAVQMLTRAPDRFSAAHIQPLLEQGFSASAALRLLAISGLSGWLNRLKVGLGSQP